MIFHFNTYSFFKLGRLNPAKLFSFVSARQRRFGTYGSIKYNTPLIFTCPCAKIVCMNILKQIKIKRIVALLAVAVLLFCGTGCDKIKNKVFNKLSDTPRETVRLTFPEGSTVAEIAIILENGGVCTAEEFRKEADNADLLTDFGFKVDNPQNRTFALEGYLFPDTYDFYVGEGANSAIKRFLNNTQKKYGELLDGCAAIGFTLDDVVILASVIQEEVGYPEEMGKVSSVIHNRLGSPKFPKLQCDATANYIEKYVRSFVSEEEYSAFIETYDTYICSGLPEGPVTNPGIDAVNAALNPEDTPYYFFVSDSENIYHYAETYSEHLVNCSEAGLI